MFPTLGSELVQLAALTVELDAIRCGHDFARDVKVGQVLHFVQILRADGEEQLVILAPAQRYGDGVELEFKGLQLRVGVHQGPCLAVQANGVADYFGRTVNIAARVEALAASDELVLSQDVAKAPGVAELLEEMAFDGAAVSRDARAVKGIAGEVEVVRVGFPPSPR